MSRIFVSAFCQNKNKITCFLDGFIDELKNFGNDVLFFASDYALMDGLQAHASLIKTIKDFNPQLIILFNNNFYDYDFANNFTCPIAVLEIDSVLFFSNKHLLKRNNRTHLFVQASDSIKNIQDVLSIPSKRIHTVPLFTTIKANQAAPTTTNISFIGNLFGFHVNHNNLEEMYLKGTNNSLMQKILSISGNEIFSLNNADGELITNLLNRHHLSINDIIGYLSGAKRIKTLSAISDLGLNLYGPQEWLKAKYFQDLILCYRGNDIISRDDNQRIYNESKIGLSISHMQAVKGFPLRVMDIMASNACLVSDYHGDFDVYFPGVQIPTYSSPYEARDLCQKLLKDESYRRSIVKQCNQIINEKYRFDNYRKKLEQILDVGLKENKEGSLKIIQRRDFRQKPLFRCNIMGVKIQIKSRPPKKQISRRLSHRRIYHDFQEFFNNTKIYILYILSIIPLIKLLLRRYIFSFRQYKK